METLPDIPLAGRLIMQSRDANEVRNCIARNFKPHDLRFLDGQRRLDARLSRVRLHRIAINVLEYGGNVMIDPQALGFYLLHLNIAGRCEITVDGKHMTADARTGAVCGPQRSHRFWWQPESRVVAIQIPVEVMAEHYQALLNRPWAEPVDFDLPLDYASPRAAPLTGLIRHILMDADRPDGLVASRVTAPSMERALVAALLQFHGGTHQDILEDAGVSAAPACVVRAERYMRANLSCPAPLSEIAAASGVCERSLSSAFRRFRNISPAAHFLALRLTAARERLDAAGPKTTVADVAFDLGFQHLSGFAAAYRRQFGEQPSQTLKRRLGWFC